jgi:hypothetical protein
MLSVHMRNTPAAGVFYGCMSAAYRAFVCMRGALRGLCMAHGHSEDHTTPSYPQGSPHRGRPRVAGTGPQTTDGGYGVGCHGAPAYARGGTTCSARRPEELPLSPGAPQGRGSWRAGELVCRAPRRRAMWPIWPIDAPADDGQCERAMRGPDCMDGCICLVGDAWG